VLIETKLNDFLTELASESDNFGGGAVGGIVAAMGISLILMSIKISIKRKSFQELPQKLKQEVNSYIKTLEISKIGAEVITDADASAFQEYMKAYRNKVKDMEPFAIDCFNVPKQLADICIVALSTSQEIETHITGSIKADLEMGKDLIRTVLKSAINNMHINLKQINNQNKHKEYELLKKEAVNKYGVNL
jgi:formiminotetrahydrofolate cyclodeaminase